MSFILLSWSLVVFASHVLDMFVFKSCVTNIIMKNLLIWRLEWYSSPKRVHICSCWAWTLATQDHRIYSGIEVTQSWTSFLVSWGNVSFVLQGPSWGLKCGGLVQASPWTPLQFLSLALWVLSSAELFDLSSSFCVIERKLKAGGGRVPLRGSLLDLSSVIITFCLPSLVLS